MKTYANFLFLFLLFLFFQKVSKSRSSLRSPVCSIAHIPADSDDQEKNHLEEKPPPAAVLLAAAPPVDLLLLLLLLAALGQGRLPRFGSGTLRGVSDVHVECFQRDDVVIIVQFARLGAEA